MQAALSTVNTTMVVDSMQVLKRRLNETEAENTRLRAQIGGINAQLDRAFDDLGRESDVALEVHVKLTRAVRRFRNQVQARPGASTPEAERLYRAVMRAATLLINPDSDDGTDE